MVELRPCHIACAVRFVGFQVLISTYIVLMEMITLIMLMMKLRGLTSIQYNGQCCRISCMRFGPRAQWKPSWKSTQTSLCTPVVSTRFQDTSLEDNFKISTIIIITLCNIVITWIPRTLTVSNCRKPT